MSTKAMARETLSSYLQEVGQRIGQRLELDENDLCGLECENGLTCGVVLLDDARFGFFAPMLDLGDIKKIALFEYLLGRNLFSLEPTGASLGYDEDEKQVLFCLPVAAETLSAETFAEKLGLFITAAGRLKADIAEYARNAGAEHLTASPEVDKNWKFIRA